MRRFIPDYGTLRAMVRLLQNFSRYERDRLFLQTKVPLRLSPHRLQALYIIWTKPEAQDELLSRALSFISAKVYISSTYLNQYDKKLIVEVFTSIRDLLIPISYDLIQKTLTKKYGWNKLRALKIESLAVDIYSGTNPRCRVKGRHIKKGLIEEWIVDVASRFRSGQ